MVADLLATSDAIWISVRTPCLSTNFWFATRRTLHARFSQSISQLALPVFPARKRRTSAQTSYPAAASFAPSQIVKALSSRDA